MPSKQPSDFIPNQVRKFIGELVYAPEEYLDVQTMGLAVTHVLEIFNTVPRFLARAKDAKTGKTTMNFDVPRLLAFSPWQVGKGTTEYALTSKFLEPAKPTLLCDDLGKVFGDAGLNGRTTKLYAILIDGYRRTATVSLSVNRVATDLPCFGVAFMNGLHNVVPGDLLTRSIVYDMKAKPSGIKLRDALSPAVEEDGRVFRTALHSWAAQRRGVIAEFMLNGIDRIHPKLEDRLAQIWGPVFGAAFAAGGEWPDKIFQAFISMALDASEKPTTTPAQQALLDTADILAHHGVDRIFTSDLIAALRNLPEGDYYRKVPDSHLAGSLLPEALGPSGTIRGTNFAGVSGNAKGRLAAPILIAAADLREMLYPKMGEQGPSDTELELAFQPDTLVTSPRR